MRAIRWNVVSVMVGALALAPLALAQQNVPHVGYVFPAGGRQGTTFEIVVGGQYLDGINSVHISGGGAQVSITEYVKPITQGEFNRLRDKLTELNDKRRANNGKWTPDEEKQVAEIRKKMATFVRRPSSPAIMETVTIQVTLASDAAPGERELRLGTPTGLTNPLVFCVSQLAEVVEKDAKSSSIREEMSVSLPAVANGRIMPGDVDKIRFKAVKGQRLVVAAQARALVPYLPDAVPGWFQATLGLYDANGREVAYDDDYRFDPDPVLFYQVPADGEYVLEIKDSIYRGREDFVYRISIGELPFVTGIFPLGAQAGGAATVELKGWNLPTTRLTPDTKAPGLQHLAVRKDGWESNRMPFAVDSFPELTEVEPNDTPGLARPLTLPVTVNGRIDKPGDWDVYKLECRGGAEIVAEVHARRLNSPLDSYLKLTDAAGKQVAYNDDHEDKGSGLTTHHADSYLKAIVPAAGTYYLHVGDAQRAGGEAYAYRVRVSAPRPDFELRVVPSSISVKAGQTVPVTVYALRKDGFAGDIALGLKDAPAGFSMAGAKIPGREESVRVTLTAPPTGRADLYTIQVEGRAMVQGREVARTAVPAEDMMQAFFYRHLVPAKELTVAVSGKFGFAAKNAMRILSPTPVRIPTGGTARVLVAAPTSTFLGKVELDLSDPPDGITIKSVSPARGGTEVVLQCDGTKIKAGTKGNLILVAYSVRTPPAGQPNANKRRFPISTLPAVPYEVVYR